LVRLNSSPSFFASVIAGAYIQQLAFRGSKAGKDIFTAVLIVVGTYWASRARDSSKFAEHNARLSLSMHLASLRSLLPTYSKI
jgi:hypothetical protein